MKHWIKKQAGTLLGRLGAGKPHRRVVILCYHSIHPTQSVRSATPELFEQHLDWLATHCDLISLDAVFEATEDATRDRPAVALTFDDGYADNYDYAFPLLQNKKTTATFYLMAGLLEQDEAILTATQALRSTDYEGIRPLTWAQVKAMKAGGMHFGAHTYSHPNLAKTDRATATWELTHSKEIIEQRMGEPVHSFAYPFGKPGRHFTRETIEVVQEAGYDYAVAVTFRAMKSTDSRWAIPRFFIINDDIPTLRDKVYGTWDWLGHVQEKMPLALARLVSPRDFEV